MSEDSAEDEETTTRTRRATRVVAFGKRCVEVALDRELRVNEFIGGLAWALYKFGDAQGEIDSYLERFVSVYQLFAESMGAERRKAN